MVYAVDEVSVHDGQPVELYRINTRNTSTYWRYTTAAYDITYDGNVYEATPGLHRDPSVESDDVLKTDLKITLPVDHPFTNLFYLNTPDGLLDITIFRGHGTSFVQYWDGIIKGVNPIEEDGYASILCGPHTDDVRAPFLLRTYNRFCDVPLYSDACGVVKESFQVNCVLSDATGIVLTSAAFAAYATNYFKGGYVVANGYSRKIKASSGNTITLVSIVPGIVSTSSVVVYPGCDHTRTVCTGTFSNLPNYRGCDFIPNEEPFTQGVLR